MSKKIASNHTSNTSYSTEIPQEVGYKYMQYFDQVKGANIAVLSKNYSKNSFYLIWKRNQWNGCILLNLTFCFKTVEIVLSLIEKRMNSSKIYLIFYSELQQLKNCICEVIATRFLSTYIYFSTLVIRLFELIRMTPRQELSKPNGECCISHNLIANLIAQINLFSERPQVLFKTQTLILP
jgi:hypothetical protein